MSYSIPTYVPDKLKLSEFGFNVNPKLSAENILEDSEHIFRWGGGTRSVGIRVGSLLSWGEG